MADRTREIVLRQALAMDTQVFEVGLFKPALPEGARFAEMLPRTWDLDTLLRSIAWLKFVETSPDNFQAWLNHGRILQKDLSTAAARTLAERFSGDRGAADWRHFGRLAGFTNRKSKHESGGLFPYVRLIHATGQSYEKAEEFLNEVTKGLEAIRIENERRRLIRGNSSHIENSVLKSIDDFRQDGRYQGDGNRIDLAYAVYALAHGVSEDQVRSAIAGRDLSHKGSDTRQADYVDRTVQKALLACRDRSLVR